MQSGSRGGAGAGYIAGVLGNAGLNQNDIKLIVNVNPPLQSAADKRPVNFIT
jgi:hypothetical protein